VSNLVNKNKINVTLPFCPSASQSQLVVLILVPLGYLPISAGRLPHAPLTPGCASSTSTRRRPTHQLHHLRVPPQWSHHPGVVESHTTNGSGDLGQGRCWQDHQRRQPRCLPCVHLATRRPHQRQPSQPRPLVSELGEE
jgi:hypothetical protein